MLPVAAKFLFLPHPILICVQIENFKTLRYLSLHEYLVKYIRHHQHYILTLQRLSKDQDPLFLDLRLLFREDI